MLTPGPRGRFLVILAALGLVAAISGGPASSDRDAYQRVGRQVVVYDCNDVHCFRVLVAAVLEHLPGPSLLKWKTYAVITSAAAALAVGRLSLVLGLSARAAVLATWIAAFGFGPLQAVFDPYTSDPLMYLLGPWLAADLLEGRRLRPGILATIGVLAKEFAAAPLWIVAGARAVERRWRAAIGLAALAAASTLAWLALQTALMTLFNDSYGANPSVKLGSGGFFSVWVSGLGRPAAAAYLLMAFGPVYLLLAGWRRAGGTLRRLAIASLPAVAAFAYVQQPDRALWNFHFVVIPIAALALEALPDPLCWAFIACFGVANVRIGPQPPPHFTAIRVAMLACSVAIAVVAAARTLKMPRETEPGPAEAGLDGPRQHARWLTLAIAAEVVVALALAAALVDLRMHRHTNDGAPNQWGFRGEMRGAKVPGEFRMALVGGSAAFQPELGFSGTIAGQIEVELQQLGRKEERTLSVVNLAEPRIGADMYVHIMREYAYLRADAVCLYDGYDTLSGLPPHGRERALIFRMAGYLPVLPARFGAAGWMSDADGGIADLLDDRRQPGADVSCGGASALYCRAMADAVRFGLARGQAVVVVTPPAVSAKHAAQQQSLAAALDAEFGREARYRRIDLQGSDNALQSPVRLSNPIWSRDGLHLTADGSHEAGQRIGLGILRWTIGGRRVIDFPTR